MKNKVFYLDKFSLKTPGCILVSFLFILPCLVILSCLFISVHPILAADATNNKVRAKNLFYRQIELGQQKITNLGLTFSIELLRKNKLAQVDSRYPFQSGDQIRFHICSNIDGYLYIVMKEGSNGDSSVLFPALNSKENNKVKAGEDLLVPQKGLIEFDAKPGKEVLQIILSKMPINKGQFENHKRSILIVPKKYRNKQSGTNQNEDCEISENILVEFAKSNASNANFKNDEVPSLSFQNEPAVTVVSTKTDEPLSLELVLFHDQLGKENENLASIDNESIKPQKQNRSIDKQVLNQVQELSKAKIESNQVADKWAVVVGISKFKDKRWNLLYADKDAEDFAKYLYSEANFKADHVKLIKNENATRENVLTTLGSTWLPNNAKKDDLVLIYFASHGTSQKFDAAQKNFLMCYDTNPFSAFATGIELQDFARTIRRRLGSNRIVFVLDTCHSGVVDPGAKSFEINKFSYEDLMQGTGQLVIASALDSQSAHDSRRYKNGIFTKHFIDGLRKYKYLADAFEYTKSEVNKESEQDFNSSQNPVMKDSEWKGRSLIISVPTNQSRQVKP